MAAPKKKAKKKPGGLTGKPPMNEPRVQPFSKFAGCDFQLAKRAFDYIYDENSEPGEEQSDLMQNYMMVQNNAEIVGAGTIQTRQNLVKLFDAPDGLHFTGVATLYEDRMYAACDDKNVYHGLLGDNVLNSKVKITDQDNLTKNNAWTFLGVADGQLVGMTDGDQIWTGSIGSHLLKNAKPIPNPAALTFSSLKAQGRLTISAVANDANPFRVTVQYTILNRFGPTLPSPKLSFYASRPTSEWSGNAYLTITGTVADGYDTTAVELYYTEGDYQEPAFLVRINLQADNGLTKTWRFNWTGYMYDTSMWTIANLIVPNQNYTSGVPASYMTSIDGQLYFWGGAKPERIWIGGGPGNRFSVSTGTGGGFVDCEPGVGTIVSNVLKFKTQQGASIVTALCDNKNSQKESRYNLVETNISISNEQSAKGWQAEKVSGTVGCASPYGAVVAADGLYTISRYGVAVTTHTMEYNSQIQVQYISDPIKPVFLKQYGNQLEVAQLFAIDDVLYMTFGAPDGDLDNVLFCYHTRLKAWWTYTLDVDEPILSMLHIDHKDSREGIGIVTAHAIYMLPTTHDEELETAPLHEILIESGELSTVQPQQGMHYLSQLEFHFDYFVGEMDIIVRMIDQFGRSIEVGKTVTHWDLTHGLVEYMRIDKVVSSYQLIMKGHAKMRLTHFISKNYPKSNRIGMVYGFDSTQSHTSAGSIQRTFANYNDLRKAIIP